MNMSSVPGSRYTIEQNLMINKHARSQGWIICVSRNMSSWRTTKHARRLYHQAVLEQTDMDDHNSSAHKDLRCSQVTHSE
jgi:hypothetical protein